MRVEGGETGGDDGSAATTPALAVVVLGCRVTGGGPSPALARRLERAVLASRDHAGSLVVVSGGKSWHGAVESRVMKRELVQLGIPAARILEEDESHNTRENAARVATLLAARDIGSIVLVTSDFHVRRARLLFRLRGLSVKALGADGALTTRARRSVMLREYGALVLDCVLTPLTGTLLRWRTNR